ncbi:helix-turn-helix domain-containing protein [Paenibacillus alba]|uniref:helix-turn-helix domain-containing protein n=1 Tax=Paenibacillus alba TaxID=1197127 RepID=UPI0015649491
MNLKELGIYVTRLREKSGYDSQRQLADASGVSHSTINRLESGTHKTSSENLRTLAKYLKGITPNELLERAGYIEMEEIAGNDTKNRVKSAVLEKYSQLPQHKKKIIDDLIEALTNEGN